MRCKVCTRTANFVVQNEFEAGGIQFAVLWGMSDVSPGRICKFNSAAEPAMSNPVGDYLAPLITPSPLWANLPIQSCHSGFKVAL